MPMPPPESIRHGTAAKAGPILASCVEDGRTATLTAVGGTHVWAAQFVRTSASEVAVKLARHGPLPAKGSMVVLSFSHRRWAASFTARVRRSDSTIVVECPQELELWDCRKHTRVAVAARDPLEVRLVQGECELAGAGRDVSVKGVGVRLHRACPMLQLGPVAVSLGWSGGELHLDGQIVRIQDRDVGIELEVPGRMELSALFALVDRHTEAWLG